MLDMRTTTDRFDSQWGEGDVVDRLRLWAGDDTHTLPGSMQEVIVGSGSGCAIHLKDRGVSRKHVQLLRHGQQWTAIDLSSKNGTWHDGLRMSTCSLVAGSELQVGVVTLVAEGARFVALRDFIRRWVGQTNLVAVDRALRSIRRAAQRQAVLYIYGEGDLASLVQSLHRRILSQDRPFILCDPTRKDCGESVRSAATRRAGMDAYLAAAGGTLCMRANRLPADFDMLVRMHYEQPRSMIVAVGDMDRRQPMERALSPALTLSPLGQRTDEIPAIIDGYTRDAAAELCLPLDLFSSEDRTWVLEHEASTLSEIEKATRRLVALRASPNLNVAAERLEMASTSLRAWLERRALPPSLVERGWS
jgi:hypothetical protein